MLKGLRSPEGAQHRPGFWEGLWNELERGLILEMQGGQWGGEAPALRFSPHPQV